MNLLSAVLWLNPLVWLVREELLLVCEYEADTAVLNKGIDAKQYQLLLIKKAVSPSRYTIANSLNHSSLKKRLTMIRRPKSNRWTRLGHLGIALTSALVLPAFAHTDLSPIEEVLQENLVESFKTEISLINPKPSDQLPESFSKEIESAPTEQILTEEHAEKPVVETADEDDDELIGEATPSLPTTYKTKNGDELLILIDGKENVPITLEWPKPGDITSVTVVKDKEQLKEYGEKGKNGVILITTKDGAAKASASPTSDSDEVRNACDVMPEFEGGPKAMMMYIAENLEYPQKAIDKRLEGRVIVCFVVRKDGKLSDINIVRGIDPELDAEALRIVKTMDGKWASGQYQGKPVNCKYTIPVSFRLK